MGLDSETIDAARQSFAVASEISKEFGSPELFKRGADAFNESLIVTYVIGGIIILVTAFVVWKLIPKGLKITEDDNSADSAPGGPIPSPEKDSLGVEEAPVNTALARVLSEVEMSSVTIPLDIKTMQEMEVVCKKLGIDVTTAFIICAKKLRKKGSCHSKCLSMHSMLMKTLLILKTT